MFKTGLFALALATSTAVAAPAFAQAVVPGSDFYTERANEMTRASVVEGTSASTRVLGTASTYGYAGNDTVAVPGSEEARTSAEEAARSNVRAGFDGPIATGSAGADDGVPGSSYYQRADSLEDRQSVR